jgi:hypothetical protein
MKHALIAATVALITLTGVKAEATTPWEAVIAWFHATVAPQAKPQLTQPKRP